MQTIIRSLLAAGLVAAAAQPASAQTVRWLTQTQPNQAQFPIEKQAIDDLTAAGFTVERNEFQALGLNLADGLRLANTGAFQIVTTQVGSVAKDDPFLEGIDLIGVSTDMDELKTAVDAYRAPFNARLSERFGVTALAIWPFGPQVFLCGPKIETLDDLKGMKVRSFTASMSTLLTELGATPVTLSFPEVYPALQRGVASCGVTSPTSSNTGKWPEVTKYLLPLSVSGSVQAHIANADWYNGLAGDAKAKVDAAMGKLEDGLWNLAVTTNDAALACSTGQDSCPGGLYTKYDMTLVSVSPADKAKVKKIAEEKILSEWGTRCTTSYPDCKAIWNKTVGAARGMTIQ